MNLLTSCSAARSGIPLMASEAGHHGYGSPGNQSITGRRYSDGSPFIILMVIASPSTRYGSFLSNDQSYRPQPTRTEPPAFSDIPTIQGHVYLSTLPFGGSPRQTV